jgi:hypothetical protein
LTNEESEISKAKQKQKPETHQPNELELKQKIGQRKEENQTQNYSLSEKAQYLDVRIHLD